MPKKKPHKYDPKVLEAMQASSSAASMADEAIGLASKTGNSQLEALKAGLEWLARTTGVPGEWLAQYLEQEAGTNKAGAKALVHSATVGLLGDKELGSVAANLAKDPEVQALAKRVRAAASEAGVLGKAAPIQLTGMPHSTTVRAEKPVAVEGKRPKGKKRLPVKPEAAAEEAAAAAVAPVPEVPAGPKAPATAGYAKAWQERAVAQQQARTTIGKAIGAERMASPAGKAMLAAKKAKTKAGKQTWAGVQNWIRRMKSANKYRPVAPAEEVGKAVERSIWQRADAMRAGLAEKAAGTAGEVAEVAGKGGLLKKVLKSPLTRGLGGIFAGMQILGSMRDAEQTRAIRNAPVTTADEVQRAEEERLLLAQRKARLMRDPELTKKLIGVLTGAPQTNLTPSEVLIGSVPKPLSIEQEDAVLTGFLAQLDEAGQNRLLRERAEEQLGL